MMHVVLICLFNYEQSSTQQIPQKVSTIQVRLLESEQLYKTTTSDLSERGASIRTLSQTHRVNTKRISEKIDSSIENKMPSDVLSAEDLVDTTEVRKGKLLNNSPFATESLTNGPLARSFEPLNQSLRELSKAKLGGSHPKDALAQGIANAGIADCLRPAADRDSNDSGLLALPSLIYDALKGKCR